MKNKKSKKDWYKGVARELSFFTTREIIKAYNNMHKRYGHTLDNVLFHSEDGVLTMIRKKSELNKLIDYIEKLSEEYIVKELEKAAELYDELEEKLINFKLTTEIWPDLLALCENLWLYHMFGIYFGYATERQKINNIKEKHYDLVVKVRNEINDLQILDDFLKNYYKNIDLTILTAEEIGEYLKNKRLPPKKELVERENEYLLLMKNLEAERISKNEIRKTIAKYIQEEDYSKIKELKGVVVFPKKVLGKARVVLKKKDLPKIKNGDILVTIMTNPEFVPYLSKVAGIVTDYGGVTCHASIISREMKIPCIVATENATKVFKDGELIEIDDKENLVRKIN